MLIRDSWETIRGETSSCIHIFKMEGGSAETNSDRTDSENSEENTSHEYILPGFKTLEEFTEVG